MTCYINKDECEPVFSLYQKTDIPWYNEIDIPEELYFAYVNALMAFNEVQDQLEKIWETRYTKK